MRCAHCWLSIARHARVASVYLEQRPMFDVGRDCLAGWIERQLPDGRFDGLPHASLVKALCVIYLVLLHLREPQKKRLPRMPAQGCVGRLLPLGSTCTSFRTFARRSQSLAYCSSKMPTMITQPLSAENCAAHSTESSQPAMVARVAGGPTRDAVCLDRPTCSYFSSLIRL